MPNAIATSEQERKRDVVAPSAHRTKIPTENKKNTSKIPFGIKKKTVKRREASSLRERKRRSLGQMGLIIIIIIDSKIPRRISLDPFIGGVCLPHARSSNDCLINDDQNFSSYKLLARFACVLIDVNLFKWLLDFWTTEKRIVSSLIHEEKKQSWGMDRLTANFTFVTTGGL